MSFPPDFQLPPAPFAEPAPAPAPTFAQVFPQAVPVSAPAQPVGDDRPTMSARELSWNVTTAGIRARKAAEAQGLPPAAREAMVIGAAMEGNAGGITINGQHLKAVTLATNWAIEESERFIPMLVGNSLAADQALLVLTLLEPERVLLGFLGDDLDDIRVGMVETALRTTPEQAVKADWWFRQENARLIALAGGASAATQPGK